MVPTQNSPAPVQALPGDQLSAPPLSLVLEVARGRTRFPRRPVDQARFLIGAGSTCNLRLGGPEIPALHSIITCSSNEIHIEAISASPALLVNGRPVHQASLREGDLITIGQVELLARLETGHTPRSPQLASSEAPAAIPDADLPGELSAAELVELIEQEVEQVEEFEGRRQLGKAALVEAVLDRARRGEDAGSEIPATRAPVPAPHFLSKRPQILAAQTRPVQLSEPETALQRELEELARQLASLSNEVQGSSLRATEREAQYASAADLLMATQERLVSQLEVLLDQVQGIKSTESSVPPKPRAIA